MRRYGARSVRPQYTMPRIQNYGERNRVQNPVFPAPIGVQRGVGRPLAERPANIRAEVEQRRRELQEKYHQEAAEAEEKRRRREQKKKEEWLKRQEALVRPGHRLGYGTPASNRTRDLIDHQNAVDCELQEPRNQQLDDERISLLVQQRFEREADALEVERQVKLLGQQVRSQRKREERTNMTQRQYPGSSNPRNMRQFSSPSTSRTSSSSTTAASSPTTAGKTGSANPRRQAGFMNIPQTASNANDPVNVKKPVNFMGIPQSVLTTSNTNGPANPRKPVNLGVAQSAPPPSLNTNCPENTRKPANFLGVAQSTPPPSSNTDCPENIRKPANFLGVAQCAPSPSTITNSETEVDHRERMRAARLRMQAQYNEEVRKAEQAKDQN